ncbi:MULTISPECIES: pyrimidine 5'-nucleotidase [Glaesserella]|uniref:DUMP phosphatase n=1 Tax=Glaesserella australis TaxID=2094024 RepID=A0A328BXZ4_9PAST|nr:MULTISPECIES: pyrimidine 5'-nucleotidase [Glaesserella]AUI65963.1 noncanonical pyrimidine nucleotidase, YjjG family [Glaesserella sp. 15-184]RAL18317.1 dUMP phosphatase [Glaesserella australis]
MKYQWILFDADETLFSFNSYLGLKTMLARYGIDFSETDYDAFQEINKPLWVAYQNKEITIQQLQTIRFAQLAEKTGKDALALNQELMAEMAIVSKPLPNVMEMLHALHGKVKMGIITNGLEALQQKRLENTQTVQFFETVVVSEIIGVAKPDPKIFEFAFDQIGNVDKSQILMVGDTLTSDILGANRVGIDSCWFNHTGENNKTDIQPTYEITDIRQLIHIVSGQI